MLLLALGRLRWAPEAVWRATPREIAAALERGEGGAGPLRSADLSRLMRAFPDHSDGA